MNAKQGEGSRQVKALHNLPLMLSMYALLCTGRGSAFLNGWEWPCIVYSSMYGHGCWFFVCFFVIVLIGGISLIHTIELLWKLHYKSYTVLKVMGGVRCT